MIKNIVKSICFLLILSFLFTTVSYVLRPHGGAGLHIQTYGMQPRDSIDVVFVGSSSTFTFWAPMEAWYEYGFTSFNFANNLMPAQLGKYCIIEALKKQSPRVVIVDVRPYEYADLVRTTDAQPEEHVFMYEEAALRNFADGMRYSLNRSQMIYQGIPKENGRLNYYFDIAKYHNNLSFFTIKNQWNYAFNIPDNESKSYGGFDLYDRYGTFEWVDYNDITEETPLSERIDLVYLELIQYCKSLENTEILFIISPHQQTESGRKLHNYLERVAAENGIAFLNGNDVFGEIGMDVEIDYYNGDHTSIFGAKKYTKWLGDYLQERYDLPDRRGDNQYADWDAAYELWVPDATATEQAILEQMPEDIREKAKAQTE